MGIFLATDFRARIHYVTETKLTSNFMWLVRPIQSISTLSEIEQSLNVRVKIWTTRRIRQNGSQQRFVVPFREPFDDGEMTNKHPIAHLYSPDLKQNSTSTKNFSLIYDVAAFFAKKKVQNLIEETNRVRTTLMGAVVQEKFENLGGIRFEEKVKEYKNLWGKDSFEVSEIARFEKLFKIGLQIWSFEYVNEEDRKRRYTVLKYTSFHRVKVNIELEDFDEFEMIPIDLCLTYIPDIGRVNYFRCPTKNCLFGTSRKYNFDRHTQKCSAETSIECKQIAMAPSDRKARAALVREGILPSEDFQNLFYCVYDVESLMQSFDRNNDGKSVLVHRLATIALVWKFDSENEAFFYRRDMSSESLIGLIQEFWKKLEEIKKKMWENLPAKIHEGFDAYRQLIKSDIFKRFSPAAKALTHQKLKVLIKLRHLRCYAWNGERYDSNVLIAPLVDFFARDGKKFSKMSTIKRKSGYMMIQYDGISLLGN